MTEQLISSETAKLAKEKGFDWECKINYCKHYKDFEYYLTDTETYYEHWDYSSKIAAPTQSLLQKWLRDVHGIHILIDRDFDTWTAMIYTINTGNKHIKSLFLFPTYESALEKGLFKALKLIKDGE